MKYVKIKGEYIQLNQLLKIAGWCNSGAEANILIENGEIKVNGVVELRKRNKLNKGFVIEFKGEKITID